MLRIALVSDSFLPQRGGIELHVADLAARLVGAGHTVDIIAATRASVPDGDATALLPARIIRLRVPIMPHFGIAYTPAIARELHRVFDATHYDVVHCHSSVISPVAMTAVAVARRRGLPIVLTFHSMVRLLARPLALIYRGAGCVRWPLAVTGVSTLVTQQTERATPGGPVTVLPNGVDLAWWAPAVGAAAADDAWGPRPAEGELRLVCAMRLTLRKRPDALLRLVRRVRATLPHRRVRLMLAGDGPLRASLAAAVARHRLADDVTLLGWRSRADLRALYRGADVFVLPTQAEAFGIAALEARAAGLPVVAFRETGVADFVREGRHGQLCASDADMTACIAGLAADRAALASLTARCRAEPPTAFGWDAVLAKHLALYHAHRSRYASAGV